MSTRKDYGNFLHIHKHNSYANMYSILNILLIILSYQCIITECNESAVKVSNDVEYDAIPQSDPAETIKKGKLSFKNTFLFFNNI